MPFGDPTPSATVSAIQDGNVDGILGKTKWMNFSRSQPITYSFPSSISDYELNYKKRALHKATFTKLNDSQRGAARAWIKQYGSVSNAIFVEKTGGGDHNATIRMATSDVFPTAEGYFPASDSVEAGDI
jgi:hypothetical protein